MATSRPLLRPSAAWKNIFRASRAANLGRRCLATATTIDEADVLKASQPIVEEKVPQKKSNGEKASTKTVGGRKLEWVIKTYPPPPSTAKSCPNPVSALTTQQLAVLDPTGARAALFSRKNRDAAKVGDILLVRQRNGDPFAGVCLNIRRQGVDTAVLLRNQLTRVGVEMWYKIFSPNVEGIEVVQKRAKRARRARLYYMRKPKHDVGSVENIVRAYRRSRTQVGSKQVKSRDANSNRKKSKKGKN